MRALARLIPVIAVVAVLAVVAYLWVPGLRGDDRADVPEGHPDTWSPKVLPFVEEVEDERDLTFEHPVAVDFLAPAEYEKAATEDDLTEEDRQEIEQSTGFLSALGLIGQDVDLYAESQKLHGVGSIGFYSFDDRRIRVRGTVLTPRVRATLVHELTHALQDQHFDIVDRFEELRDSEDGSSTVYRALVEGDAERIEDAYLTGLSAKDRDALAAQDRKDGRDFRKRSQGIPPVLVTLFGAPYALGGSMVAVATALDGDDAVDRLFADPPTTEEHLLDPWTLLADDDAGTPVEVGTPPTGDGEDELDSGTFGAFGWYVVLAQRVDPKVALRATDGWGGDAYSTFERDGRTCVRVDYRGDTRRDVDELAAALDTWIEGSPDSAVLQRAGAGLTFASCESGAEPRSEVDDAVLGLPAIRAGIAAQVLEGGAPAEFSRCFGQASIEEFTVEELGSEGPELTARAKALAEGCVD